MMLRIVRLALLFGLLLPVFSWSGELRDYRLYSDKPSVSPNPSTKGSDAILEDFQKDIKTLSNEQKLALKKDLSAKLKDAQRRGQNNQITYYSNLLSTLEGS